jgi:hypothetical protein
MGAVGFDVQNEQRGRDGEDAVAECLKPGGSHEAKR